MREFERLFRIYMILMLPALLISLIQFSLPSTHFLNSYVSQEVGVEAFTSQFGSGSQRARTAGVFSYVSGNLAFNLFMMTCSLCLLASKRFSLRGNTLTFFVFLLSTCGLFTTGSRSGLVAIPLVIIVVLIASLVRGLVTTKAFNRIILLSTTSILGVLYISRQAVSDLLTRTVSLDDTSERILSPITQTSEAFEVAPLIGTGLASTHGGLITMIRGRNHSFEWLGGKTFEVEPARVLLETGVIGFVLLFGLKFANIFFSLRILRRSMLPINVTFASGLLCWFTIHLVLFIVTHPTAALYYYFGLGILFLSHFSETDLIYRQQFKKPYAISRVHKKNLLLDRRKL